MNVNRNHSSSISHPTLILNKKSEFSSSKNATDWIGSIEKHVLPVIGQVPIADINLKHILSVVEPIWAEKTEAASRIRQRIELILWWAAVSQYRQGDNPARWVGNL